MIIAVIKRVAELMSVTKVFGNSAMICPRSTATSIFTAKAAANPQKTLRGRKRNVSELIM